MKILFIDEGSSLQEKWIEPLRGEGWGVVRARSTEDAEKILEFHGESLSAIVVSENFVDWAEKWNYPYIVFIKTWKEAQVLKHQNTSPRAAVAYLEFDSNLELLKQSLEGGLRATGTSATSAPAYSKSKPSMNEVKPNSDHESVVISFEKYSEKKIEIQSTSLSTAEASPVQDLDRTMMLESTSVSNARVSLNEEIQPNIQPEIKLDLFGDEIGKFEEKNDVEEVVADEAEVLLNSDADEVSQEIELPVVAMPSYSSGPVSGNKDLDTMKNYLALREQDVALLTGQMRSTQERVQQLEMQLKMERARSGELQHMVQKQEQQIQNFERDKQVEFEVIHQQVEDLNLQLREKTDKVRTIEAKLKITTDEVEKVKERVRVDIRRIRVREKELEGQLEILKKDSTALLVARDEKIVELKRKIDLLEFNMELVQEQYAKERNATEQLRHKLKEASGVMNAARGLLDSSN